MEKDETVSDCSPHIANIGRLVEVSGLRLTRSWYSIDQRASPQPPSLLQLVLPGFSELSSDLDTSRARLQAYPPQCPCSVSGPGKYEVLFPLITGCEQ